MIRYYSKRSFLCLLSKEDDLLQKLESTETLIELNEKFSKYESSEYLRNKYTSELKENQRKYNELKEELRLIRYKIVKYFIFKIIFSKFL